MPNIDNSPQSNFLYKPNLFFGFFVLIIAVGRTWGLLDEYLIGRFFLFSVLGLWALIYLVKDKDYKIGLLDIAFLVYYSITAVSLTWSLLPSAGYFSLQSIGLAYVFYVLFRIILSKIHPDFLHKIMALCSVLVMAVVISQFFMVGLKTGINNNNIYEITGWAGHKNLTASLLFLLFGLNSYYFISGNRTKWISWVMVMQLSVILILQSRAVMLALVLFLGLLAGYIFFTKNPAWIWIKNKMIFLVSGAMLFALILFFSLGGTKSDLIKLSPATYLKSSSGSERMFVWYKTAQLINDHWIRGYGAGNWKLVFPSKGIEGAYRLQTQNVIFTRAHNDYLEIWAETGIIGLISYLSLFILSFFYIIQKFRFEKSQNKVETLVPMFLLMGYMVIAFFDFPKERMEHTLLLSLLFALAVNPTPGPARLFGFSFPIRGNYYLFYFWVLVFILIVNCVYSYYIINGEYHTRKAMEAKVSGQWQKVEQESKKAYSSFYQINPIATSVKWFEGNAVYNQGKYIEAEKLLSLASQHTPYHFFCLNDYASTLVQLRKYQEAIEIYKKVLFINPRFEDAMFNISFAYAQVKNFDKALEWVGKTKTLPEKRQAFMKSIEELRSKN